jgi:hypothetical protein
MAYPAPAVQGYSFTDHSVALPSIPQPGDKLDQELAALRAFTVQAAAFLQTSLTATGTLKANIVGFDQLDETALFAITEDILDDIMGDVADLAQAWAEHLDGNNPIPPEVLARTGVTGDHWSARWWANRAAQDAQRLEDLALEMAGGGMLSLTYDPQGIAGDAFDRANHTGVQDPATVDGLIDALATLAANDAALAATDAGLQGQIDAHEARLDSVEADIVALEASDTALDGRLDTAETDIAALEVSDIAIEAQLGQLAGRNVIVNGNFDIWQRGTSLAAATGARYLADRWVTDAVGSTAAPSRQGFTLGQTDVPYEPEFFHRVVVVSATDAANYAILRQRIEGVRTLAGQTATISFYAKADAGKNIAINLRQVFGTGGSPSATVNTIGAQLVALTASWQRFEAVIAIPGIAGKTLGSNANDQLELTFWLDAGANFDAQSASLGQQSGTFDIAQVQLEPGDTATRFERRSRAAELALCERYYQIAKCTARWRPTAINQNTETPIPMRAAMRATPTTTITGGSRLNLDAAYPQIDSMTATGGRFSIKSAAAGESYAVNETVTLDAEI